MGIGNFLSERHLIDELMRTGLSESTVSRFSLPLCDNCKSEKLVQTWYTEVRAVTFTIHCKLSGGCHSVSFSTHTFQVLNSTFSISTKSSGQYLFSCTSCELSTEILVLIMQVRRALIVMSQRGEIEYKRERRVIVRKS